VYHDRHGFTKALALEVAQWVTVNTISPGYIGTKMVMAIPKDVLDANSPSDPRSAAWESRRRSRASSSTSARMRQSSSPAPTSPSTAVSK
jgi:NAD(P)-dependent dehydrogenase (short-subunit alcohol dehydrogenase family)